MRKFYYSLIWSLLLLVPQLSFAQWPATVDSALFVDYGLYPYLVVDESDQSIIVAYLRDNGIWAKKFDRFGYPMWDGNHVVLTDTAYGWLIRQVAYPDGQWGAAISDGDGGVIVAWEDYRNATFDPWENFPEGSEVYLQRVDKYGNICYDTNGKKISGPATDGWHSIGDMKTDYHGGFYIGFSRDSTTEHSVLKHFANDGALLWQRFFPGAFIDVCATNENSEVFINIKPDEEYRRMKVDMQGNYLWPDTLRGLIPDWTEYRLGGAYSDGRGGVIGLQANVNRVDSEGKFVFGSGIDINYQGAYIRYAPDGNGGIYINWSVDGISIQRVSVNGELLLGQNNLKICEGEDCHGSRGIVEDGQGGAITMWGDTRKDSLTSFYAQHIDSLGKILWDSLGLEFHSTKNDPFFTGSPIPLHSDGNGGAILLWNESGNGNQIFIKQISYKGILGDVPTSIPNIKSKPLYIKLLQNYPNPFNNNTTISFRILNYEKVKIKIFNALGQEIKTILDKRLSPGNYNINFNAEGLASGVFFYQLRIENKSETKKMLLIQ